MLTLILILAFMGVTLLMLSFHYKTVEYHSPALVWGVTGSCLVLLDFMFYLVWKYHFIFG